MIDNPGETVLIVGGGPVGLSMGIELLRHGVPCRVIEQRPEKHAQSRATDIHARTIEVFQDMGIANQILERGQKRAGVRIFIDGRCAIDYHFDDFEVDTPFCFDIGLPQNVIEEILESRFNELGGHVERGTRLAIQSQDKDAVTAVLLYPNGRWEECKYPWLIACDGARSTSRQWLLNASLQGSTFEEAFFLADVTFTSDPFDNMVTVYSGNRGMLIVLPMPGERAFRIFGELEVGSTITEMTPTMCQNLVDERMGLGARIESTGWGALFRVHTRMVEQYRHGRVLLAGDAAHIHSPMGGHGMNMGVLDAYNLAWKLALVIHGKARSELLDSYGPERAPVARGVLEETDSMTRTLMVRRGFGQALLSRVLPILTKLPPQRRKAIETMLETGFNYRSSPAVDEHLGSVLEIRLRSSNNDESASLRERIDFSHAPQAGDRAPNVKVKHGVASCLFDLLQGTCHVLMLFDGHAATADGYTNLATIANTMASRWGEIVKIFVIVPRSSCPAQLGADLAKTANVVLDADGALHRRYGATKECLYLIRPDGYIGFRSQPADRNALVGYLERWYFG